MHDLRAFTDRLADADGYSQADYAVALIWYNDQKTPGACIEIQELAKLLHELSLTNAVNRSRLEKQLGKKRELIRGGPAHSFKLRAANKAKLDELFTPHLGRKPIKPSNSIIPMDLFKDRRSCWKEMVLQINGSYDHAYYDGCAVMCRRLMESLLIESFKARKAESVIARKDGQGFEMLERIIDVISSGTPIRLTKSSRPALNPIKRIGDTAAHSPHYITTKQDVDGLANPFRVVVSELLSIIDSK